VRRPGRVGPPAKRWRRRRPPDLEGEAGDLAQRRVRRGDLLHDAVLRALPRRADRVREAVQPLGDAARALQRGHLLARVGRRPAQRDEAGCGVGERVRQAAAFRRAVRRSTPERMSSRAAAPAAAARLASSRATSAASTSRRASAVRRPIGWSPAASDACGTALRV
jgi:hypothetical protein